MALDLWLAFTLASITLLTIPGPTVLLVISYALGQGKQTAWASVPAVALGDFTAMTVSLLGAGALLATSATLFTAMKWAGALYLVWLGLKLWRDQSELEDIKANKTPLSNKSIFLNSFVVTALNPKGIVFFIAFVPQFIDPAKPAFLQFAILELTFVMLAAINTLLWALLAGRMRQRLYHPKSLQRTNHIGAGFLIGAGFMTLLFGQKT
ncbi:MAG: LysE family translocator [Cohaesibacter sp.]|nr:LysE family translocator [Cohaesibacter sp.]